jgi:hypothetical protein
MLQRLENILKSFRVSLVKRVISLNLTLRKKSGLSFMVNLVALKVLTGMILRLVTSFENWLGKIRLHSLRKRLKDSKNKHTQMGASAEKAEELVDWYLGMVAQEIEESNTAMKEAEEEMDKELRQ